MLFGRMLRKNPRKAGAIVDGRKGLGFRVLLLNLSKFSFSLSPLSPLRHSCSDFLTPLSMRRMQTYKCKSEKMCKNDLEVS
jgi:hypothetical protein